MVARRCRLVADESPAQAVDDVRDWLKRFRRAEQGDFLRLWKALWYCMWLSDKPPTQQELAEVLAGLAREIAARASAAQGMKYVGAFFTLARMEWMRLDKWRLDKFRSLMRKMLSAALHVVAVAVIFTLLHVLGPWVVRFGGAAWAWVMPVTAVPFVLSYLVMALWPLPELLARRPE